MLTVEQFKKLPTGRVLHRAKNKARFRTAKPQKINRCNMCTLKITGIAGRWERGGGHILKTLCPLCSVIELNRLESQ